MMTYFIFDSKSEESGIDGLEYTTDKAYLDVLKWARKQGMIDPVIDHMTTPR